MPLHSAAYEPTSEDNNVYGFSADGATERLFEDQLRLVLPEPIQSAIDAGLLQILIPPLPHGVDEHSLILCAYHAIREEYGPFEISQSESIDIHDIRKDESEDGVSRWILTVTHGIDLDFCSISDKSEDSLVEISASSDFSSIEEVNWIPGRRFGPPFEDGS